MTDNETPDRRHRRRREDDIARDDIVEGAVKTAPIVTRLLKTGQIAGAALGIGALIGLTGAFIGIRLTGPKDEIEAVRRAQIVADSLQDVRISANTEQIAELKGGQRAIVDGQTRILQELEIQSYTQCIMVRRFAPDVRPKGCNDVERRGGQR